MTYLVVGLVCFLLGGFLGIAIMCLAFVAKEEMEDVL